jgi:glycosyltransferase involved in cell wall biosynthesis
MGGKDKKKPKYPTVTLCTPTFNRRPFIPMMLKCFEHQTYPKDKIEWLIVDDGTDKIEDLVTHIPQIKYFKYDEKMTLGKKRNLLNDKATGDIIIFIDDDDYYPPERISHAVKTLTNSKALCAGSSAMFIYFKHINTMYLFGPYGPNHATAATFAFKRELLATTRFDENSSVAEERKFLKDYTVPFVQLEAKKSILVFSHNHNSFDKKELLKQMPNPNIHETPIVPSDLVKEKDILKFFMEDIEGALSSYEPGKPQNKPDVTKQLIEIKEERQKTMVEMMQKQKEQQETINMINMISNPQQLYQKYTEQANVIQNLNAENSKLTEKNKYLENKIKELISAQIGKRKEEKKIELSTEALIVNTTNNV